MKPLKGLLLIAGKSPKGAEGPAPATEPPARGMSNVVEDKSLSDAFQAAKRGDEQGFKTAMMRAIRACVAKEMADGY